MPSALSAPHFHNEEAAYAWVEARLWPNGPVCPRCQGTDRITVLKGSSTRIGVRFCNPCRKPFNVKVGTIFESSHIPLRIWLQAIALLCASKKGMSSNQLHRTLGLTLKSAWFLSHRIREAMRGDALSPLGAGGKIVEADETYFGKKAQPSERKTKRYTQPTKGGRSGPGGKRAIVSLVERGGEVRSFHVENADKPTVNKIVSENIAREARLHTDESRLYGDALGHVAEHETVKHSAGEYVRGVKGPEAIHTNSAEGYFSIFKRGMKGVYQHCKEKHLHRYLAEFDFRYNARVALGVNDTARADKALRGVVGKRLTYRPTDGG
ncbi:MAG TPA: IS1595 family transposase [Falsiroseomonas sp.]|nr:IS1595 family transposase [Falsiroseomonas sp.]